MSFSDEDLYRLKLAAGPLAVQGIGPLQLHQHLVEALLARLEAAESALSSCKRYQYDDGLIIVEEPNVELYEAWRRAAGK